MSIFHAKKLTCPKCGAENRIILWDSLNAQIDPQAREALLNGQINQYYCNSCGETGQVMKSLLYHDMESRFMVWYYPSQSIEDERFFEHFFDNGQLDFSSDILPEDPDDYTINVHYVFSMDELVRYIRFREKLAEIRKKY